MYLSVAIYQIFIQEAEKIRPFPPLFLNTLTSRRYLKKKGKSEDIW